MRFIYQGSYKDLNGSTVSGGNITVYLAGTSTLATIYTAETGGSADSDSIVASDVNGHFYFYVDTKDYATTQKFKITLSKTNYQSKTYDDIAIFPTLAYRYIADPSETDQGATGNGNTIKALVDAIGATNKESIYLPPGSYTLTTSETITSNITIVIPSGAQIDGAGTLTINGGIDAGSYQIFGSSITIAGTVAHAKPEWWPTGGATAMLSVGNNNTIYTSSTDGVPKIRIGNHAGTSVADTQILIDRDVDDAVSGHGHAFSDASGLSRNFTASYGYNSYDAVVSISGANNIDHYAGFQQRSIMGSSGTMNDYYSFYSAPVVNAGTVTDLYHFYIADVTGGGGGVVTNNYGLYMADLNNGVTLNYGLFLTGSMPSHINGNLAIGVEAASVDKLHVRTANVAGGEKIGLALSAADMGSTPGDTLSYIVRASGGTIIGAIKTVVTAGGSDIVFYSYDSGGSTLDEVCRIKGGTTPVFNISGVPAYANNAAAVSGGLAVGDVYRNGDVMMIVH